MQELDLPRDPCNPDSDYNFYACVRKYTTKKVRQNIWEFGPQILADHIVMLFQVGCRTKWNYWSDKSTPFCTGQQYRWIWVAHFPRKMAVSEFWKNGMRASTILDMKTLERRLVASNHASTWNTLSPLHCTAMSILHTTHSLFWYVVFHSGWQNLPGILWIIFVQD